MRKVKKMIALALTIALCTALLAGCAGSGNVSANANSGAANVSSGSENAPQKDPIVIRIGGTVSDTHPVTITEYKFKELFEAATNGAYEVQVYTNCALGSPLEMLEAVQLGNLEMCDSGNMVVAPYTKMLTFMDIPYIFSSREVALQFVDSEVAQGLYDRMAAECGIRPLLPMDLGYMTLSNNVREIHKPEDLKGIKFRVQDTPMYIKYFETLGGSPTPMALNEVFTAAQQGTIDGITTQNAVFNSQRFYEVIEYVSDMNPYYCTCYLYTSEKWYQSLPDDVREIFLQCVKEATEYGREVAHEYIEKIDKELETACTVTHLTDEERAAFVEGSAFMIDYFKESVGDPYLDEYLAEIAKIEASLS